MKIGLLGHGTIGIGVDRIIKQEKDMEVTSILSLVIDDEMAGRTASSIDEIVNDKTIDTVVEVMGGVHPAYEFISACLKAGKNVVTANKAVVAACYDDLLELAKEHGVSFRSTAAVGGSIPWLVNIERAKRVGRVLEVGGIMNGTTNYILHKMVTDKVEFDGVLKEAQDLGYAEKDPSADIDGDDIRRKIMISSNVAFGVSLKEDDVQTFGIRSVRLKDIEWAQAHGLTLKLVAHGKKADNGAVMCYLEPSLLQPSEVMASIPKNYNLVFYTGEFCGTQSFIGEGAGRFPTAYNVVEDLKDILAAPETYYTEDRTPVVVDNAEEAHPYYVRTQAAADDFLSSVCDKKDGDVILTKPVSVKAMLSWAKERKVSDPELFIAGMPD